MRSVSVVLSLPLLVAACGGATTEDLAAITSLTGTAESGKTLYVRECATCHGADGKSGTERRNITDEAKSNPDGAVRVMLDGEDDMPGYLGTLSSQDLADILAYLKTL